MQNRTVVLVAMALAIALAVGGIAGAQYQKAQPVNIDIDWYSSTNDTAYFDTYSLSENGMVTIVPDPGVDYYGVLRSH